MKQYLVKVDDEDIVIKGDSIHLTDEYLTIVREDMAVAVFHSWNYWFEIIEDEA